MDCSPGWSVSKTDGAHNRRPAQIFHVWLLLTEAGPVPLDWSHSSHYLHHTPERHFISNLGLYSGTDRHIHTPSWLAYYLKLELCSVNHSTSMFLIGCIVWVSGGCGYRCWHVAALLLAFPLRRAWLSSWQRWHVDNPTDWRKKREEGGTVSVYTGLHTWSTFSVSFNGRLRRNTPSLSVRKGGLLDLVLHLNWRTHKREIKKWMQQRLTYPDI